MLLALGMPLGWLLAGLLGRFLACLPGGLLAVGRLPGWVSCWPSVEVSC